jgi:HD-GYP domain-containing protein (c-di-GMP phosphodiesterase class II)
MINIGCHADAHEQAKWYGDDIALKATKFGPHDMRSVRGAVSTLGRLGAGNQPLHRLRVALDFALWGHREVEGMIATHNTIARSFAEQLGLPPPVGEAVATGYERWDGKGWPGELAGEAIPLASRVVQLAEHVEVAHRVGGIEAACALARERSGGQFDPALVDLLVAEATAIFDGLDAADSWRAVIDAEPSLAVVLSGDRLDAALAALGTAVDVKSPYWLGHSQAVADLAAAAGERAGLTADEVVTLRRAALVYGLGRLGISNSILDKRGPLSAGEWERVRMHPYLTERMLHQSATLAPLAAIAAQSRERVDGSGYPRGLSGSAISRRAGILGAADAYQAMREPRPHRPPLTADEAAAQLRTDVKSGFRHGDAVDAVLAAAGHRVRRRRDGPAGLTPREVEVLRLLAQGLSNKEIAQRLSISPKTAGTHIEHIYAKIDASSRAVASLFAVQHGLLPDEEVGRAA